MSRQMDPRHAYKRVNYFKRMYKAKTMLCKDKNGKFEVNREQEQDLLNPDNNQNAEIPNYRLDLAANEPVVVESPTLDDTSSTI